MRGRTKLAVVTDSLKGIGYRIVCTMLKNTNQPLTIYMTGPSDICKNYEITFKDDLEVAKALEESGSEVKFAELDFEHSGSIKAFRDHLQDTYGASHGVKPLSILVNSPARIFADAERSVDRTYFGTKNLTRLLLPIMKRTGDSRIVNVSVDGGQPGIWIPSEKLAQKLVSKELTEWDLDNLMRKYQMEAANGKLLEEGWSKPQIFKQRDPTPYIIPKLALAVHARILAKKAPGVLINASGGDSWRLGVNKYKGAITPTFLALGDLEGVTGGFWISGKRTDWETGKPVGR